MSGDVDSTAKVAIITGAAGGLGLAVARTLAKQGVVVVGVDRDDSGRDRFLEEIGQAHAAQQPLFLTADVTSHEEVSRAVAEVVKTAGRVDILVTCAGIREIEDVLDITPQRWSDVIATNLTGTFFFCQEVAKAMVAARNGGAIITISSVAGMVGIPNRPAYTATKHAIVGLTKNLAVDLARYGIRVNSIAPGTIRTPLTEAYWHNQQFVDEMAIFVPLHDRGTPHDVGAAVAFLVSEQANFITGITLPVDGGFSSTKSYSTGGAGSPYVKA